MLHLQPNKLFSQGTVPLLGCLLVCLFKLFNFVMVGLYILPAAVFLYPRIRIFWIVPLITLQYKFFFEELI